MELLWHIVIVVVAAAMILVGANWMTSGSVAVARRFGISDFVIGLTLVALGSSAPDLAVGLFSACKGHTQFAIGNVVGSCIFDGLLVVGAVALIRPFRVSREVLTWQLPCLLLAYIVISICANDGAIDGFGSDIITRAEGLLMLIIFGLMLWQTLSRGDKTPQPEAAETANSNQLRPSQTFSDTAKPSASASGIQGRSRPLARGYQRLATWINGLSSRYPWPVTLAQIVLGLGALVWGGNLFVDGASGIAREGHVSDTVIGLTVVALGTSLPDLATSAVAAWRGRQGIAIGNVVGSCLFDAMVVLGASSLAAPLPMGGVGDVDLAVMLGGGLLLLFCALGSRQRRVYRWEGLVMIAIYALYTLHVVLTRA